MPALGNALGLPFGNGGPRFKGALDAYASGLVALYSPFQRLLSSYTGNGIRVRRSSDSTLQWIGFNADGSFDETSYLDFIGAGNGFAHTIADQSGAGLDQTQTTAAAQAQIGVDGNGDYYLYAPGAGSATTSYQVAVSPPIAAPEFMIWGVGGASGFWQVPITLRNDTALKERSLINYGNSINAHFQDNATGSVPAGISLTPASVYSCVFGANGSESKMTNRLSTTTGTRVASSCNIESVQIGRVSGGPAWLQNAPWYMGGAWISYSAANLAAIATLGKTLIPAAQ